MKFALVCGASGNIGTQVAMDLAQQGWSLYLHYYSNQKEIEKLQSQLAAKYPKQDFFVIQADFNDESNIQQIVNQIFNLDAVVFAQGTTNYQLLSDFSEKELTQLVNQQLLVPVLIVKSLSDKIAKNTEHGRIVFIGSVYGSNGSAMEVPYSMIKGGISSFANAYAKEVATLGITVNVVAPGAVQTKMNSQFDSDEIQEVVDEIPVGRLAKTAEISHFVLSILDENASYLTGQTVYVDGGWKK